MGACPLEVEVGVGGVEVPGVHVHRLGPCRTVGVVPVLPSVPDRLSHPGLDVGVPSHAVAVPVGVGAGRMAPVVLRRVYVLGAGAVEPVAVGLASVVVYLVLVNLRGEERGA